MNMLRAKGRKSSQSRAGAPTAPSSPRLPSPVASSSSGAPTPPSDVSRPSPVVSPPPPQSGFIGAGAWSPGCTSFPPQGTSSLNPWGYVQGGLMNLLHQPNFPMPSPPAGENFHFVGVDENFAPTCPPPPPFAKRTPPSAQSKKAGMSKQRRTVSIDIDSDDGGAAATTRTTKTKRHWTHEEEVRLASAWLKNSKDPIGGNDKKGERFWGDITEEFNKNGPAGSTRDTNQLKIHWTRLKASINSFNGCWSKVTKVNKSGMSDDQLMDEAQEMYTRDYGKPFALVHWWRTLKNEPKWCAHLAQLEKEHDKGSPSDVVDVLDAQRRPIGRDAAKAQRNGKRKAEEVTEGIVLLGDNISKIIQVQQERKQEREKVTEAQLEIARLQLKAAKERKEAMLLEVYNSLLHKDTSKMDEQAKAKHQRAMDKIQMKMSCSDDEA